MQLLAKERLIQTSAVDHADWNYDPRLAYVMRRRFALVRKLLPRWRVDRALEIGFGSGIFMPELATRCADLYGIDVHPHVQKVQENLASSGVAATLTQEDAAEMKFADAFFDLIVSVSALEFVQDISGAAREMARVLTKDGRLVAVMPVKSPLLDSVLRALTGADPKRDYGDRRERVVPALLRHFRIVQKTRFLPTYIAYAMQRID